MTSQPQAINCHLYSKYQRIWQFRYYMFPIKQLYKSQLNLCQTECICFRWVLLTDDRFYGVNKMVVVIDEGGRQLRFDSRVCLTKRVEVFL